MVGQRLRLARQAQRLSLQRVADQASISVATLSRIETNKQTLDVNLFLQLAKILHQDPADILRAVNAETSELEPLVQRMSGLNHADRMALWHRLAIAANERQQGRTAAKVRQVAMEVEELLAQIDFLRAEIAAVNARMQGKLAAAEEA